MPAPEIEEWLHTSLFDEVPVGICVIDGDFQIVKANRWFVRTYGFCQGRPCYEVYKGRGSRCDECAAVDTFTDGQIRSREEPGAKRNGYQSYYLVHMFPVVSRGGTIPYVIEMSTDITLVKRLEREKREAERLAAVGETVAGIAHGIKNVLMGLEGGLYAVNTGIAQGDDNRVARGWSMLEDNIGRISEFVKEFLDFAKGRPVQVSMVDPAIPARKVVELFSERAQQAGIELKLELQDGIPAAPLDEEGIHTCLTNLISNALDACSASDGRRKYEVTLSLREENGTLWYEVKDNGHGMDYEISRKVFSKFFTTKGSDKGTGLGLLTTKKVVHQHGGRVTFETRENEGSVFRVELPRKSLPNLYDPDEADATRPEEGT